MKPVFDYCDADAFCEGVRLADILQQVGSPVYVYSRDMIEQNCQRVLGENTGENFLACYAVKANSNLSILKVIFQKGLGADVVSGGEMTRALHAGCKPEKILFSGVGKQIYEIEQAVELKVKAINVESLQELEDVCQVADRLQTEARVAFRVNPNIDVATHPKIATGLYSTKFGMSEEQVRSVLSERLRSRFVKVVGLSCHLGSQIADIAPYRLAAERLKKLGDVALARGHQIDFIDLGGGMAIAYANEVLPDFSQYTALMADVLSDRPWQLVIEPGRFVVGPAGWLLTTALITKETPEKNFVVLDAAMNDLLRPALYGAYHEVKPLRAFGDDRAKVVVDFVGPVCETGDTLASARLVQPVKKGDQFAIADCGAYGAVMASRYNTRPMVAEVLVEGNRWRVIRPQESLAEILKEELALLTRSEESQ